MMLLRSLCTTLAVLGIGMPLRAQAGDECRPTRTALVLSGGGAAGLAHVGVIRVLDSLGIRPDLIVGSSMGAVVGAMYASGYSGNALDSIVRALPLERLFRAAPALPAPLAEWPHQLAFHLGNGKIQPVLPFVNERELNLLLSAWLLEGNLQAAGDFDALPIPFRAVATDLEHRQPFVLSHGDLAYAVRASIAIPVLFRPLRADGHWLGDGSLTANVPVPIAREFDVERVIVSDATNHLADTLDLERWGNMGTLMMSMLLTQRQDSLGPQDVLVRSDVSGLPKFDFSPQAKAMLIEKGVAAGLAALPDLRCGTGGPWRAPDRRVTAPVRIAAGTGRDGRLLQRSTGTAVGAPLDPDDIREGLRRIGSRDAAYDALWLNPRVVDDSVQLFVAPRPSDPWLSAVGLAFDSDLGVRGWIGIVRRRAFAEEGSFSVRVAAGRWRQEADAAARFAPLPGVDLIPLLSVAGAHEDVRDFSGTGVEIPAIGTGDVSGLIGAERDLGAGWIARLGATYAGWRDSSAGVSAAPGIAVRVTRHPAARGVTARAALVWNPKYARVALEAAWPFAFGPLHLTPGMRYGWGRGLPLQHRFPLGGYEGFPGRQLGERRGDHETLVRLDLSYRIVGPVRVTAQGAGGLASMNGEAFPIGAWLWGARLGLGIDVPFGPLRIEYGRSTGDRSSLFLRFGKWF